jgi:heat shock protein HslJ
MGRSAIEWLFSIVLTGLIAMAIEIGPVAAQGAGEPPDTLEDQDWQLASYRTSDGLQPAKTADGGAVVRFSSGRFSGSVGCNRLMGVYRTGDSALRFDPRIGATMMACPPEIMAQEQAVIDGLQQAEAYRIDDGRLIVEAADGTQLLTFSRYEAPALTGTRWRVIGYNNGRGGVTSVLADTEIVLQLDADGRLAGKVCNNYRGGFEQDGERLRLVGPIASTRMACPTPEGAGDQETAYLNALARVERYRIEGNQLTLLDADGATLARFRAEPGTD